MLWVTCALAGKATVPDNGAIELFMAGRALLAAGMICCVALVGLLFVQYLEFNGIQVMVLLYHR